VSASSDRPRDRLGRPLAVGDPRAFPEVCESDHISSMDAWSQAQLYLEQGLPFHAHEVFEQRWKSCPPDERDAWQALAQWGAALTHQARGNEIGQRRIASRALDKLTRAQAQNSVPSVIAVDRVLQSLTQLA
jgi:hypothetical protein